jgi:hypothetical protein
MRACFLLFLALVTAAAPAVAQTTGRSEIEGRVTDDTGAVLPGVTVTASSPAMQVQQLVTTTEGDGRYRFPALPVGVYRVAFELAGFGIVIRENLEVSFGTVATVDVKMAVGQLQETLTVSGQTPVVDVRTTTATTNLPKEMIHTLPTNRTVADLVKLAPGVRGTTAYGAGGTISHTYDGVQARDTFRYPDVGMLEEAQIRAGGNDAEVATSGVNFVAVVKSGGNTFQGYYMGQWEGEKLQSNNLNDELRAQGVTVGSPRKLYYDSSADLGGRIIRDRLWFYGSMKHQADRRLVVGFRGLPGPDGVYFTPDDEEGLNENRDRNYTGKMTARLASNMRLNGLYAWEEGRTLRRGAGAFTTYESTGNYFLPNDLKKVEFTWNPTNRSIVNAFVGNTQWNSLSVPYSDKPPAIDNFTRYISGAYVNSVGSDSTPAGSNSERWIYNSTYTYYRPDFLGGDHDIKTGVEFTREWYDKFQHARDTGTGGRGNDFRLYFESGAPFEVLLYNSPFLSENSLNTQTVFVRDNWLVNDRLTLSLGVRAERYHGFLPEQSKPAGPYSSAAEFAALDVYDWRTIVPRVGFSYSLTADKKTVVKSTYGRFTDVPNAQAGRVFNQNDYYAWRYKWNDLNGNRTYDHSIEQGALVATESAQGAGLKILNPDLEQAKAEELAVHVERELLEGFALGGGYVYKRRFNQFEEINPARPFDAYNIRIDTVDPGPDGVRNTADDGGPVTYYDYDPSLRGAAFDQAKQTNTDGFEDTFHNIEIVANKRMSQRWQMMASILMTNQDIWRSGTVKTPNDTYPKTQYWESIFKMSGAYQLPWTLQLSGYYEYLSGAVWGRTARFTTGLRQLSSVTLYMESPTAQRRPNQGRLDVRLQKSLRLPTGQLNAGVEVYNLLNTNVTTNTGTLSGPTYGRVTAIAAARNARLMLNYRF